MNTLPDRIELGTGIDAGEIARVFQRTGRVHIPGVLAPATAAAIYTVLARDTPWQLSVNPAGRHMDLGVDRVDAVPQAQRAALLQSLHEGAREGFQYLFNNFPMFDLYRAGTFPDHPLMRVYEFLNGEDFLGLARRVTGIEGIAFADAQATLYRPGHFLTAHDDNVSGKNRLAAYVLSLTPDWRADWGGILQFIDDDGHVAEGYTPAFNALSVLRVPQKHAVSYVAPFAGHGRYSITGWFRGSAAGGAD